MSERSFVYIDGESHFIRSEHAWRILHGEGACLEQLRCIGSPDNHLVLVRPKAKVFWTRRMNPGVKRSYYFTAAAGDDSAHHDLMVALRNFDLEPFVVKELKAREQQRQNALKTQQVIEKAKGVDIALAVRMLEDAHVGAFDTCHLYTSDADFVPLIEAVKARGKQVVVHGYRNGLAKESSMLHVPDQFIDLEAMLRCECEPSPDEVGDK
jgi:uncharacterized LabA/DUF88 family protein